MSRIACSTSSLVYLYRINGLQWLPGLFDEVLVASFVLEELLEGRFDGFDVPNMLEFSWVKFSDPQLTIPSEWVAVELSRGDLITLSLALENSPCTALVDDAVTRRAGRLVGLTIKGTLGVLLDAKNRNLIKQVSRYVNRFSRTGIWLSDDIRNRILTLAGENKSAEE